jgi:hypothetical protein
MTDKTKEFIDKAKEIHSNKFDYSKVEYKKCDEKVIIICKEHGEFEQKPYKHLSKQGCAKCIGRGLTKKDVIIKLQKTDKFQYLLDNYDDNVIMKKDEKIKILCDIHGIFEQSLTKHLRGQCCPKCNPSCKDNKDSFTLKFLSSFPDKKFNFEQSNYINSSTKIKVICDKNHLFEIRPNDLLNGHGCNICKNIETSTRLKTTLNELKTKILLLRGNNIDTTKLVYDGTDTKCIFICTIHNIEYKQRPHNLLQGKNGCYKCNISKQHSKPQIQWLNFIQLKDNITIQHAENIGEYKIPNTRFKSDGYCIENNTMYEFHGDYWHGNPNIYGSNEFNNTTKCTFGELYKNTLKKEQLIRDLGYNLVIMWEYDWNKINKSIKILQRKFRNSKLH